MLLQQEWPLAPPKPTATEPVPAAEARAVTVTSKLKQHDSTPTSQLEQYAFLVSEFNQRHAGTLGLKQYACSTEITLFFFKEKFIFEPI